MMPTGDCPIIDPRLWFIDFTFIGEPKPTFSRNRKRITLTF